MFFLKKLNEFLTPKSVSCFEGDEQAVGFDQPPIDD
jgi:hypothetical protein